MKLFDNRTIWIYHPRLRSQETRRRLSNLLMCCEGVAEIKHGPGRQAFVTFSNEASVKKTISLINNLYFLGTFITAELARSEEKKTGASKLLIIKDIKETGQLFEELEKDHIFGTRKVNRKNIIFVDFVSTLATARFYKEAKEIIKRKKYKCKIRIGK